MSYIYLYMCENTHCTPVMKPIWSLFVSVLLGVFTSTFIREIVWSFLSCCVFIWVWCPRKSLEALFLFMFWIVMQLVLLWRSGRILLWLHIVLGHFLVRRLHITASILLLAIGLFKLFHLGLILVNHLHLKIQLFQIFQLRVI